MYLRCFCFVWGHIHFHWPQLNICKTTKSKLLQVFESEFPGCAIDADSVPADAMAVLQSTVAVPETYGELADDILARILAIARKFKASRLDFVADRYPQLSIKHAERKKRASHGASNVRIYGRDQKVFKPWEKFISSGRNKENIVAFLLDCWSKMNGDFLEEIQLYVTSREECTKLLSVDGRIIHEQVEQLSCDHEQAETRLMLHATHAAGSGSQIVLVKSPDTDVFILALRSTLVLPETSLYLNTGVGDRSRIILLDTISRKIGLELCSALPGFHAFTSKFI